MRPAPVHYLRPNDATKTPRTVAYLDVAWHREARGDDEVLRLRCWAAALVVRHPGKTHPPGGLVGDGRTAAELAEWLDDATRGRDSTWLYAHDLGHDLVTTHLPSALTRAGWHVSDFAMSAQAPWLRAKRGRRGLTLLDSWSVLPAPLAELAAMMRLTVDPEPAQTASDATWRRWAHGNVRTLAAAVESLLSWWDREDLGRWNITGPTTGWAAMRHTLPPKAIVIDPRPEPQTHDRRAVHTGRRGVWSVGDFNHGPYLELDIKDAYPSVAEHLPLPRRRGFEIDGRVPGRWQWIPGQWEPLAECVIDTPEPRFPWASGKGPLYPVGQFVTTLAGPDLAEAKRLGALVELRRGYLHELGYQLAPWGAWVNRVANDAEPGAPAVARVAGKAWGRSVIGKFGTRSWERTKLGEWAPDEWRYEDGWNRDTDAPGGMVWLDGQTYWTYQTQVGPDAYPAVNAWVEAYVRVRLGRIIAAIGPSCVLQANTDGLICDGRTLGKRAAGGSLVAPDGLTPLARRHWMLDRLNELTEPLTLRIKQRAASVSVLGPQTYTVGGERRHSGVPKSALTLPDGRLSYRTWPSLTWQLQHGSSAGYVRPHVVAGTGTPHPTGWLTTAGRVLPPITRVNDAGVTELVPWRDTLYAQAGHTLAKAQHPALRPLR